VRSGFIVQNVDLGKPASFVLVFVTVTYKDILPDVILSIEEEK
jgi:hypothetical protein